MKFSVGLIGLGKIGALYDINNQNIMSHLKAIIQDDRFDLGLHMIQMLKFVILLKCATILLISMITSKRLNKLIPKLIYWS